MWTALTTPATTEAVFAPLASLFLVVFAIGFVFSILVQNDRLPRFSANATAPSSVRRMGPAWVGLFGAGLFFFGVRALQINPFGLGMPIWLWVCAFAAFVLGVLTLRTGANHTPGPHLGQDPVLRDRAAIGEDSKVLPSRHRTGNQSPDARDQTR